MMVESEVSALINDSIAKLEKMLKTLDSNNRDAMLSLAAALQSLLKARDVLTAKVKIKVRE